MTPEPGRVAVVVATRDRKGSLLRALAELRALPERPEVVIVDNGSADGTLAAVQAECPWARLIRLERNAGAAARNVGARATGAPYVAFSDDDSWWAPGALSAAAGLLDADPLLALVAARVLVGPGCTDDPVSRLMAESPLPREPGQAGMPVLGFVACGSVVRRSAFLGVGGFSERLGVGGEEGLLAIDLAEAGWRLSYHPGVVAHHHPSPARDPERRRGVQARNDLWCAWLRRPLGRALAATGALAGRALRDTGARRGLREALSGARWVARERRVVSARVEGMLRRLERAPL